MEENFIAFSNGILLSTENHPLPATITTVFSFDPIIHFRPPVPQIIHLSQNFFLKIWSPFPSTWVQKNFKLVTKYIRKIALVPALNYVLNKYRYLHNSVTLLKCLLNDSVKNKITQESKFHYKKHHKI